MLHIILRKLSPLHRSKKYIFWKNLIDILYHITTFLIAIMAAFVVLYSAGDWLLLGLAIMVMVGLLWSARNILPDFFERSKLLLNIGAVREGERIVYNGIPWKIG